MISKCGLKSSAGNRKRKKMGKTKIEGRNGKRGRGRGEGGRERERENLKFMVPIGEPKTHDGRRKSTRVAISLKKKKNFFSMTLTAEVFFFFHFILF